MREASPWRPRLGAVPGPASERLVSALSEDITSGVVPAGTRLPAHRSLAVALGISVATVTKAYAALERRGLVRGQAGRGTFAAFQERPVGGVIDLAVNTPPQVLGDDAVRAAMTAVASRVSAWSLADYGPSGGHYAHRRAACEWTAAAGLRLDPDEVLLCNGARQAIAAALLTVSAGGSPTPVFTEELTFGGTLRYARLAGHPVHAVGTDGHGMHPDALDRALAGSRGRGRAARTAARPVVYVTPTLHNPTTATMTGHRRRQIAAVARRHDAVIVEDDVYALGQDRPAPALAELAPDRVYYVTSASKALSSAIRVGILRPPAAERDRAAANVHALAQPVSPVLCDLLAQLTAAGIAAEVRTAIRHEGARRSELARSALGPALQAADTGAYHTFLPLDRSLADAVVATAAAKGVALAEPASLMADPASPRSGIRICLGAPAWADLGRGLETISHALGQARAQQRVHDTGTFCR